MNLLNIIPNPPLSIKPSPPAHTHQLTKNQINQNKIKQEFETFKINELLNEIKRLNSEIRNRQSDNTLQKQKYLKQILLLSVEIQHQREIIRSYHSKMTQLQTGVGNVHSMYQMKLQTLKRQMIESFSQQLKSQKVKTFDELSKIRQNYQSKLASALQNHKEREYQFEVKWEQSQDLKIKIDLLEGKLQQKENKLVDKNRQVCELEKKLHQDGFQLKRVQNQYVFIHEELKTKADDLSQKLDHSNTLKEELHLQYLKQRQNNQRICLDFKKKEHQNQELKFEVEDLSRKILQIQKEKQQLQRKYTEIFSEQKKGFPQHKIQEKQWMNSKQTKRQRNSQVKKISSQNQGLSTKLKQYDVMIKDLKRENENLQINNGQLEMKNNELSQKLIKTIEDNQSKQQFFKKRINGLQKNWYEKQKQFNTIAQKIEKTYLNEISELKKKNIELDKNFAETIQMSQQTIINLKKQLQNK